jgi:restriction system protein
MFGDIAFGESIFAQANIALGPLTSGGTTGILLQALVIPTRKTSEGELVQSVGHAWIEILNFLNQSPENIHQLNWRKLEALIAAAYDRLGFEEVTLTWPSGDKGRDVIAISKRYGAVKFLDQAKAYSPDHVVTANDVRAMVGVLATNPSASKGLVITTSFFRAWDNERSQPDSIDAFSIRTAGQDGASDVVNSIPKKP